MRSLLTLWNGLVNALTRLIRERFGSVLAGRAAMRR
jgi:hypothetical protein